MQYARTQVVGVMSSMRQFKSSLFDPAGGRGRPGPNASEKPNFVCTRRGRAPQVPVRARGFGVHVQHAGLQAFPSRPRTHREDAAVGMSDDRVIQAFVRDYGAGVYLAPPSAFAGLSYAGVGLGLVVIWLFIRKDRNRRHWPKSAAGKSNDRNCRSYKDQIGKGTSQTWSRTSLIIAIACIIALAVCRVSHSGVRAKDLPDLSRYRHSPPG